MRLDRALDGNEWVCTMCGHVDYGDGFTPLDLPQLTADGMDRQRRREPRHGKVAL